MKLSVRVSREDLMGISVTRLFRIGLQEARTNPACREVYTSRDRHTVTTSIAIRKDEYLDMQWLGLRARETIQIGIDQVRHHQP